MMSFLVTVALAGAAPAQCGYGGYAGYGEPGGYGGNAWGTFHLPCCLPDYLPALPAYLPPLPAPSQPSAPADVDNQIDQKLKQLKELLDHLEKRLKKLDKKQKGAEAAIETLAIMHEEMARTMEHKLAELQIMSRTLELKIGEESLRQKTEALAERSRALEAAEKQRQQMARLEDSVRALEKKPAKDALARTMVRDLERQIADLEAIMKTKVEVIEDKIGGLAKQAQEDRLRQHFSRLDQRMRHIEEHFQQEQKTAAKIPANRALLMIDLPADAKLFLNDKLTKGESARRYFLTPELKAGTTYSYTLRMEMMRNGAMTSATQMIYFRAGKAVHASFAESAPGEIRSAVLP